MNFENTLDLDDEFILEHESITKWDIDKETSMDLKNEFILKHKSIIKLDGGEESSEDKEDKFVIKHESISNGDGDENDSNDLDHEFILKPELITKWEVDEKPLKKKAESPLPVQCSEESCTLSFDTIGKYKSHALGHGFACTQFNRKYNKKCNRKFNIIEDLQIHESRHRGEKPFSCSKCDKSFYTKQDLRLHNRKHTGEKPFPCDLCEKWFSRTQQRKVHMAVHTGEKKFECPECNIAFASSSTLIDHKKRKHLNVREHKCAICEKSFYTRQELEAHVRVHTGEKPFMCSLCGKGFARLYHFNRHKNTVHNETKLKNDSNILVVSNVFLEKYKVVAENDGSIVQSKDLTGTEILLQNKNGSPALTLLPSYRKNTNKPNDNLTIFCILEKQDRKTSS